MSNPYSSTIKSFLNELLKDETITVLSSCEGESIDSEEPNRDISQLVDDCYACDYALLEVFQDDKAIGNVMVMPYEASEADEIFVDWHTNPIIDNAIKSVLTN